VFNAYGPLQRLPASNPPVIPYMLRQAVRGGTLVVHGAGTQTRDYVYVDDVVNAMVVASTAPGLNNQVINIGSGVETSVRELANLVLQVTGSNAEVIQSPRNDAGVSRMCADLTLAKELLSYQPRLSLADGLRQTLVKDARFKPPQRPPSPQA